VLIVISFLLFFLRFWSAIWSFVWLGIGVCLVLFGVMMGWLFIDILALSQMICSANSSTIQIRFNDCFKLV